MKTYTRRELNIRNGELATVRLHGRCAYQVFFGFVLTLMAALSARAAPPQNLPGHGPRSIATAPVQQAPAFAGYHPPKWRRWYPIPPEKPEPPPVRPAPLEELKKPKEKSLLTEDEEKTPDDLFDPPPISPDDNLVPEFEEEGIPPLDIPLFDPPKKEAQTESPMEDPPEEPGGLFEKPQDSDGDNSGGEGLFQPPPKTGFAPPDRKAIATGWVSSQKRKSAPPTLTGLEPHSPRVFPVAMRPQPLRPKQLPAKSGEIQENPVKSSSWHAPHNPLR